MTAFGENLTLPCSYNLASQASDHPPAQSAPCTREPSRTVCRYVTHCDLMIRGMGLILSGAYGIFDLADATQFLRIISLGRFWLNDND